MDSNFNGPVNIGNESEIQIIELARLIDKRIYNNGKFSFKKMENNEPKRRCPSIKLAKQTINWQPKICLEDGLISTIKFFKSI